MKLYKSLTWDRGKEMADHQRFTLAAWRIEYSTERPQTSIRNRTPPEFASERATASAYS
jgi:hypothetical protein